MVIRRLKQEEHARTRALWEEVFQEDTKAFLDYYYYIKTRDNQIFVIEEDSGIRSMIHLNPYQVKVENRYFPSAYIIAVATDKPYRSRGYMGTLLRSSLQAMYDKKMPFTFLMPAAEAIYTPYDFRYIYDQPTYCLQADRQQEAVISAENLESSDAGIWDAEEMAEFYKKNFEGQWQVTAVKDREYYQTMILEQQSEHGGVRLLRQSGDIVGMYAYAAEDELEVRELLCLDGFQEEILNSVAELKANRKTESEKDVKVYGCPEELASGKRPLIMARIVCFPALLSAMKVPEDTVLECSFAVLDPIIHQNSRVWKITSRPGETQIRIREYEDSEGVIPVADFTEYLFGRIDISELAGREGVLMSEHLAQELEKIEKLSRVCFNEVV